METEVPNKKGIDKAKRVAAGHACFTLFTVCGAISHGLRQLTRTTPPSGVGFGEGLTEQEKQFINRLASDFSEKEEVLRHLGWRFRGDKK